MDGSLLKGVQVAVMFLSFSSLLGPHPGIEPMSPALAGEFITTEPPGKFILDLLHRP